MLLAANRMLSVKSAQGGVWCWQARCLSHHPPCHSELCRDQHTVRIHVYMRVTRCSICSLLVTQTFIFTTQASISAPAFLFAISTFSMQMTTALVVMLSLTLAHIYTGHAEGHQSSSQQEELQQLRGVPSETHCQE